MMKNFYYEIIIVDECNMTLLFPVKVQLEISSYNIMTWRKNNNNRHIVIITKLNFLDYFYDINTNKNKKTFD